MNPREPPALATWTLEHMRPRGSNEALSGDLLEAILHRSFSRLIFVSGYCGNRNGLGPERVAPPRYIVFCRHMISRLSRMETPQRSAREQFQQFL
jgi:hypothetical protein